MNILEFGNKGSNTVLIQPVDDHDLAVMDSEEKALKETAGDSFHLITIKVNNWNNDLSPWKARPVFGNEDFGGGADDMLQEVLRVIGKAKGYVRHWAIMAWRRAFLLPE